MVIWKTFSTAPSIVDGSPVPQGGYLDLEGPKVFEKIAAMPKGTPITPEELDTLFGDFLDRHDNEIGTLISHPILWAATMGYHIVYSPSDYRIENA